MAEWIVFTGNVSLRKKQNFSLKKHMEEEIVCYSGEFHYSEHVLDDGGIRTHAFRLALLTGPDAIDSVLDALRDVPGQVKNLWIEGWVHL